MRCFYIEELDINSEKTVIKGYKARHIINVLRLGINDNILIFDRGGNTCRAVITGKTRGSVEVRIIDRRMDRGSDKSEVVLAQAITKGRKMDFIVQKSIELGVSAIVPFFSRRSIPRWDRLKAEKKTVHWKKIVSASVEQSGIRKIPAVENIMNFQDLCRKKDYNEFLKLILWENEIEMSLKKIFSSKQVPEKIIFMAGPEGGFSEDEVQTARENDFIPVSIGNYILRSETVSVALLTIIRYEQGMLG